MWMIYGAYGFTGRLIAELAKSRGHSPLLSGRRREPLEALAEKLELEHRVLDLSDASALRAALEDVDLVVHAAGPFVHTAAPMMEACIAAHAHYTDITGEITVFDMAFDRDARAADAGVVLMPGAGFDVVPSDCLALHVSEQVTDPTQLEIAIYPRGKASGGTTKSVLESVPKGNFERRGGELVRIPMGNDAHKQRFIDHERWVMQIPWGDLVTAYHSTGVPNIKTYMTAKPQQARALRWGGGLLRAAMSVGPVRGLALSWIGRNVDGPDDEERERGSAEVWARATNRKGESVEAWVRTADGYVFTAESTVRIAERLLESATPGARTPAMELGADFVLEIEGSERFDSGELAPDERDSGELAPDEGDSGELAPDEGDTVS